MYLSSILVLSQLEEGGYILHLNCLRPLTMHVSCRNKVQAKDTSGSNCANILALPWTLLPISCWQSQPLVQTCPLGATQSSKL